MKIAFYQNDFETYDARVEEKRLEQERFELGGGLRSSLWRNTTASTNLVVHQLILRVLLGSQRASGDNVPGLSSCTWHIKTDTIASFILAWNGNPFDK